MPVASRRPPTASAGPLCEQACPLHCERYLPSGPRQKLAPKPAEPWQKRRCVKSRLGDGRIASKEAEWLCPPFCNSKKRGLFGYGPTEAILARRAVPMRHRGRGARRQARTRHGYRPRREQRGTRESDRVRRWRQRRRPDEPWRGPRPELELSHPCPGNARSSCGGSSSRTGVLHFDDAHAKGVEPAGRPCARQRSHRPRIWRASGGRGSGARARSERASLPRVGSVTHLVLAIGSSAVGAAEDLPVLLESVTEHPATAVAAHRCDSLGRTLA
jgi:hypothetical protein